jgi:hypothetical protein
MDAFAEITFDVLETVDAGEWAIVSTVLHGRGGGSGAHVDDGYVFAYKLSEDLVVEGWEFNTMQQALKFVAVEQSAAASPQRSA